MMRFVLSIVKLYSFHLLSLLCQRRSSCWIYRKWCSYVENPYLHAKIVDKKIINVLVSPYCTLLFSRKEIIKFSEVAVLYLPIVIAWSVALWSHKDIGLEILTILQRIFACLSKTAIKRLKQNIELIQTFFISHFAALRPTLDHRQGAVLTDPMLITTLFQVRREGHANPRIS